MRWLYRKQGGPPYQAGSVVCCVGVEPQTLACGLQHFLLTVCLLSPRSWGDDPVYNDSMPTSVTTSSCPFFAAVGILPGVGTTGVGADNPSMDGAGRFVTYT